MMLIDTKAILHLDKLPVKFQHKSNPQLWDISGQATYYVPVKILKDTTSFPLLMSVFLKVCA